MYRSNRKNDGTDGFTFEITTCRDKLRFEHNALKYELFSVVGKFIIVSPNSYLNTW